MWRIVVIFLAFF